MRMQSEEWRGVSIINDAYNANPASMKAALQTLAELPCRGRRIAVLGDMFELGKQAAREHRQLGKDGSARRRRFSLSPRRPSRDWCAAARSAAGMGAERVVIGKDHAELVERLREHVKSGDWLLFKGSRGMKMEKVLHGLTSARA